MKPLRSSRFAILTKLTTDADEQQLMLAALLGAAVSLMVLGVWVITGPLWGMTLDLLVALS